MKPTMHPGLNTGTKSQDRRCQCDASTLQPPTPLRNPQKNSPTNSAFTAARPTTTEPCSSLCSALGKRVCMWAVLQISAGEFIITAGTPQAPLAMFLGVQAGASELHHLPWPASAPAAIAVLYAVCVLASRVWTWRSESILRAERSEAIVDTSKSRAGPQQPELRITAERLAPAAPRVLFIDKPGLKEHTACCNLYLKQPQGISCSASAPKA